MWITTGNYQKKKFQVLLGKRAGEPYKDKWSLPGTFVGKKKDLKKR